jgi:DNA polymerase-3 subunit delta
MTFEEILKELKNKIYKPVYFLYGEEPYFIDIISNYISKNVLTEAEKSFNQTILYGKDVKVEDIDNAARRFPMMANHQVIIVKEAQNVKNIEKLVYYTENPLNSTILVINYKYSKPEKRSKLYKALEKNSVLFESKKIYENQIPAWINKYLSDKNFTIEPVASNLLAEFLGTDLAKIANELEKLQITLPQGTKINAEHIEKNIGISKDYNNFELQNAIKDKDILKANRIINHFAANPKDNPMVLTITALFFFFSKVLAFHYLADKSKNNVASVLKVNPYFVKDYEVTARNYSRNKIADIISILSEYDMKSKGLGSNSSHGDLLKELIFKIMH